MSTQMCWLKPATSAEKQTVELDVDHDVGVAVGDLEEYREENPEAWLMRGDRDLLQREQWGKVSRATFCEAMLLLMRAVSAVCVAEDWSRLGELSMIKVKVPRKRSRLTTFNTRVFASWCLLVVWP